MVIGMDFDDTMEEAAFRSKAREWLASHAEPRRAGRGPRRAATDAHSAEEADHVRASRRWQRTLYDGGWTGITWPTEYGGRGGAAAHQRIFDQEEASFDVPATVFSQAITMAGPTIIEHGTSQQRAAFLDPILRGDVVFCQLFSEPEAGSDLAALRTRAEVDGDAYVVNGQKVWTSNAHYSDWGILLARTNPAEPRHKGITYFLVDMTTPGIEVRPLRQITGAAHFNEVFLTDVRVPAANIVGHLHGGWAPTITTLSNERTGIAGSGQALLDELVDVARRRGASRQPLVRQRLATLYTDLFLMRLNAWRTQTASDQGRPRGPESSVGKLAMSNHVGALYDTALSILGADGAISTDDDAGAWVWAFLNQWAMKIGGGTDEIQRNTIAERVLGLPKERRN
jgi:alkylation response protein AidB-like acyl-CoA dehydrogenase